MIPRTVGELIAHCYTLSHAEFLGLFRNPVLIGVRRMDRALAKNPNPHRQTLTISLDPAPGEEPSELDHPFVGIILEIKGQGEAGGLAQRMTVGRAKAADITLNDPSVSEMHCYLKREQSGMLIGDLGSTNGTMVNGKTIKPPMFRYLKDQDVVTVGRCGFQFFWPEHLYEHLQLS